MTTTYLPTTATSEGIASADAGPMLARLMANLGGFVYRRRHDAKWTMLFLTDACRDLTGYDPHRFVENQSLAFADLIHSDDRKRVQDEIAAAVAGRRRVTVTYRIVTAHGVSIEVEDRLVGVYDATGRVLAIEGVIDRARFGLYAARARRRWEGSFAAAFRSHPAALVLSQADGTVCAINEALVRRYKLSADEIIEAGSRLDELLTRIAELEKVNVTGLSEGGAPSADPNDDHAARIAALGVVSVPVASPLGYDSVLTLFPDRTRWRQAEARAGLLERQWVQAQKKESVGQSADGISHNLNNVIHALMLHVEVVRTDPALPDTLRTALGALLDEAQRASRLSRRL